MCSSKWENKIWGTGGGCRDLFQQEEGNFPLGEVGIKKRWVQKIFVGGNGGRFPMDSECLEFEQFGLFGLQDLYGIRKGKD